MTESVFYCVNLILDLGQKPALSYGIANSSAFDNFHTKVQLAQQNTDRINSDRGSPNFYI